MSDARSHGKARPRDPIHDWLNRNCARLHHEGCERPNRIAAVGESNHEGMTRKRIGAVNTVNPRVQKGESICHMGEWIRVRSQTRDRRSDELLSKKPQENGFNCDVIFQKMESRNQRMSISQDSIQVCNAVFRLSRSRTHHCQGVSVN